jgi:hypothetical protein
MSRPKPRQSVRRSSGFIATHTVDDGLLFSHYTSGGTKSEFKLGSDGNMHVTVHRKPDAGETGQHDVRKVLIGKLRDIGHVIGPDPRGGIDDRGEDFVLDVDGKEMAVQVAVVPQDSKFWKDASRGSAERSFTPAQAVEEIQQAILAKQHKSDERIVLALDIRHVAPFARASIVAAYLESHPDPAKEYGWRQVWLVGSYPNYCVRLTQTPSEKQGRAAPALSGLTKRRWP